jgi:hypothetical protein
MKNNNLGPLRNAWRLEQREWEILYTVTLKTATPRFRPITDLTLSIQIGRKKLLLIAMSLPHFIEICTKVLQNVRVLSSRPSID